MERPFHIIIPDRQEWISSKDRLLEGPCWYTDGSKTAKGVGAGVYGRGAAKEQSMCLGGNATIFQAEIFAIDHCANLLLAGGLTNRSIKILTDSQAALKALASDTCALLMVQECHSTLAKLGGRSRLRLIWVPGHSGIEGNEKADSFAA
ncbi:hypothetical protein HHI36_002830 [Cryptolaemus montrouzieri]|uniref:RNase H type-1 domain-containing protein n=1 Tax=Cryptolaemus montrouzieri TaxID=559131 RepID=A0ABD2PBQ7_9CUCU